MSTLPDSRSGSIARFYARKRPQGQDRRATPALRYMARLLDQFEAGEEVADFEGCRFRRVGTVRAIVPDAGAEFAADRARRSLCGIGSAHGVAPFCDGAF